MRNGCIRVRVIDSAQHIAETFPLFVLLFSFSCGAVIDVLFPHYCLTIRYYLAVIRISIFSESLRLLIWIGSILIPCFLIIFLSTSVIGWFFLQVLFLSFGCITAFFCRHICFSDINSFLSDIDIIFTIVLLLPAMFLLGEVGYLHSMRLFRSSRTENAGPSIKIPTERVFLAFAFILLAALVRQFIIPLVIN